MTFNGVLNIPAEARTTNCGSLHNYYNFSLYLEYSVNNITGLKPNSGKLKYN